MAKRDGDGEHAWPLTWRHALQGANELVEEVVGKEFLNDERHECARPAKRPRACGKQPQRTWTQLRPPVLGIELLFRPEGVFELRIDVERDGTDLAHGSTSTESARETVLTCRQVRRAWTARGLAVGGLNAARGMCPREMDQG